VTAPPRPTPGQPRAYAFPDTERRILANGLTVITAPIPRLPAVSVLVLADAGAERDPAGQAGLGAITARGLSEGTRRLSGDELADAFERLGGELDTDAGWTRAECGTTVLASRLEPTLQLIGDVLREPAFTEHDVTRLREERLAELLQIEAEPRELADDQFARIAFGPTSRYAEPVAGSTSSVSGLTQQDVALHFAGRYLPRTITVIMAGDVRSESAFAMAESLWGEWDVGSSAPLPDVGPSNTARRAVHLVARPDAPQTEIRVGHPSVPRLDPDFHAITVMNAILGGLFNSRINLNLRERHAFTYGAFSSFDWRRHASLFEVSTAVRSDVTAAAVTEILSEIGRICEADVSEKELSLARDYLAGVFPIRFETTAAIASAIATQESFGLDPRFYDEYRDRIAAVTVADVRRVAERVLDPQRVQVLLVGDPQMIRGPVEALDLGEVHEIAGRTQPTSTLAV
jgi:zinc protease